MDLYQIFLYPISFHIKIYRRNSSISKCKVLTARWGTSLKVFAEKMGINFLANSV